MRRSRSRSPPSWARRSRSRSRSHSRQMKRRLTPPASPPSRSSHSRSSSSKVKYAPTSLASELSKHLRAREMRDLRDAQMAATLRKSVSDLPIPMESKRELKIPKERTPEPEYSRKERLLEAREANIIVKVENIQHNHGTATSLAETRQLEPIYSPKRQPLERVVRQPIERVPDIQNVDPVPASVERNEKPNVTLPKDSPGFENVSDVEQSPTQRYV